MCVCVAKHCFGGGFCYRYATVGGVTKEGIDQHYRSNHTQRNYRDTFYFRRIFSMYSAWKKFCTQRRAV